MRKKTQSEITELISAGKTRQAIEHLKRKQVGLSKESLETLAQLSNRIKVSDQEFGLGRINISEKNVIYSQVNHVLLNMVSEEDFHSVRWPRVNLILLFVVFVFVLGWYLVLTISENGKYCLDGKITIVVRDESNKSNARSVEIDSCSQLSSLKMKVYHIFEIGVREYMREDSLIKGNLQIDVLRLKAKALFVVDKKPLYDGSVLVSELGLKEFDTLGFDIFLVQEDLTFD